MNSNVLSVRNFNPKSSHTYFLDNNVLMLLFCPIGNYQKNTNQREYSRFFYEALNVKSGIVVNSLVLSEFCNASLRIDFNLWKKETQQYNLDYKKDFVGTKRFVETVSSLRSAVKSILKVCHRTNDEFNSIDENVLFSLFGECDFNDAYYQVLSQKKGYKVVTEDYDFFQNRLPGIEIITARI